LFVLSCKFGGAFCGFVLFCIYFVVLVVG
jgi:hypothetical protein